jgi:hypothetical protein
MSMGEPHAHIRKSIESISASELSLFVSYIPLYSSQIDVLFSSFGIYSIVIVNCRQSIIALSIFWAASRCAQHRSLSLAQRISLIHMRNSYAHVRESAESISAVLTKFSFSFCFGLCFPLLVHQFSPYPGISFLGLPLFMYAIFLKSSP